MRTIVINIEFKISMYYRRADIIYRLFLIVGWVSSSSTLHTPSHLCVPSHSCTREKICHRSRYSIYISHIWRFQCLVCYIHSKWCLNSPMCSRNKKYITFHFVCHVGYTNWEASSISIILKNPFERIYSSKLFILERE